MGDIKPMRFADRYPAAPIGFQVPDLCVERFGSFVGPCVQCGTETDWLDLSFGCPICSEECHAAEWTKFEAAFNRATELHGPPMVDDLEI